MYVRQTTKKELLLHAETLQDDKSEDVFHRLEASCYLPLFCPVPIKTKLEKDKSPITSIFPVPKNVFK